MKNLPAFNTSAFSLIETLFATVVISVLTLGLLQLLLLSGGLTSAAREQIQALQVIESKMEAIRSCSWDELGPPSKIIPGPFVVTNGLVFHGMIRIRKSGLPESYRTNLTEATITAEWTSGKLKKELTLSTFISPYGICASESP